MDQTPPPPAPFEGFACFSVYAAGLAFNRVYKRLLDRFGLTYPQYLVLVALRGTSGRTVGELGDALFLDSNTLTPMLKRMETTGLVARNRDNVDQRVVRVSLTEQGAQVAQELTCIPHDVTVASGMTPEALSALEASLNVLTQHLRNSA